MQYEVKENILYINGKSFVFPRDLNFSPVSVLFGIDLTGGNLVPLAATPDGKLDTTATLSGTVTLGAVTIEDRDHDKRLDLFVDGDTPVSGDTGLIILGKRSDSTYRTFVLGSNSSLKVMESPEPKSYKWTNQDLSGGVSLTTNVNNKWKFKIILFKFSGSSSGTLTISLVSSSDGWTTIIGTTRFTNETYLTYTPNLPGWVLMQGDEVKIEITAIASRTVSIAVRYEEV